MGQSEQCLPRNAAVRDQAFSPYDFGSPCPGTAAQMRFHTVCTNFAPNPTLGKKPGFLLQKSGA